MEYYTNIISFVWVTDIKKSLQFYTDILGFKQGASSSNWTELAVPGLHAVYVALNKWDMIAPFPANNFITLGVENISKFKSYLISQNIEIKEETEFYEEGIRMLKFFDPDRNILTAAEVIQF